MRSIRTAFLGFRLPPSVALALLCALLATGQIAETAHDELECKYESCSFCIGSANDAELISDEIQHFASAYERTFSVVSAATVPTLVPAHGRFIRGPPHDLI